MERAVDPVARDGPGQFAVGSRRGHWAIMVVTGLQDPIANNDVLGPGVISPAGPANADGIGSHERVSATGDQHGDFGEPILIVQLPPHVVARAQQDCSLSTRDGGDIRSRPLEESEPREHVPGDAFLSIETLLDVLAYSLEISAATWLTVSVSGRTAWTAASVAECVVTGYIILQ